MTRCIASDTDGFSDMQGVSVHFLDAKLGARPSLISVGPLPIDPAAERMFESEVESYAKTRGKVQVGSRIVIAISEERTPFLATLRKMLNDMKTAAGLGLALVNGVRWRNQ